MKSHKVVSVHFVWSHSCPQTLASNHGVLTYFSPVKHLVLNCILIYSALKKLLEARRIDTLYFCCCYCCCCWCFWLFLVCEYLQKMFFLCSTSVLHNDFLEAVKNKNTIPNIVLKGCSWFMFWCWKDAYVVCVFFGKISFPLIGWNFLNVHYPSTWLYHVYHIFYTFTLNTFLVWLWHMKYKYKIATKQITILYKQGFYFPCLRVF